MTSIPEPQTVSAFIVCKNEERRIRRCLESVAWCAEIVVVVDTASSDKTVEICKEFTDRIFFRQWSGYVEQKRFGLEQCSSTWILNLDADEEVSPELAAEMQERLANPTVAKLDGFQLNRVVLYLGRWWRKGGWYPEYRLRLCRRSRTTWGGTDPHERASVQGPTARLRGELRHYTYVDIRDHVLRLNSHSSAAAESLFKAGKRPGFGKILLNPPLRFLKFYLIKRGYREGYAGVYVGLLEALQVYLKYLKLWERHLAADTLNSNPNPGMELRQESPAPR